MTADLENAHDVFVKVIQHLALFARDTSVGAFDDNLPFLMAEERLTVIPHPFVCQRGHVRSDVAPRVDLVSMRQDVTVCPAHTYEGGKTCHMHPTVDSAHLAAWALAGPDAFAQRKPGPGWSSRAFDQWRNMLVVFSTAIVEHDYAQEKAAQGGIMNVGSVQKLGVHNNGTTLETFTIKIRPGDHRRRRRR